MRYHLEKMFGCCFLIRINKASDYLGNLAFRFNTSMAF